MMPNPQDLNPQFRPTASWPLALGIVGLSISGLVGVYWLIVHLINLIGMGVMGG